VLRCVVFTPQKGGRHNIKALLLRAGVVVFTPQKGGRHNRIVGGNFKKVVVFTPQKGGRHNQIVCFPPILWVFLSIFI